MIASSSTLAGQALSLIAGVAASSGGYTIHKHNIPDGFVAIDSGPNGQYDDYAGYQPSYPPSYSLLPILAITGALMDPGIIVMWSGTLNNIPTGYVQCDGNNNTPDLRDKFVIGGSATEGTGTSALIAGAQVVSGGVESHIHSLKAGNLIIDSDPDGDLSATTDPEYNYPPCYSLAFIMKT